MKFKIALAFATASFFASSASAQEIWRGVTFGMPRSEIEAMFPKGDDVDYQKTAIEISDISIIEKCNAEVNIRFDDANNVNEVMIAGDPSMGGRCSEKVIAGLSSKYGEPLDTDKHGGSILGRQGRVFIWRRSDGITMRLKKYSSGVFGGGGLGKASWELTYSKLGDDIGL